MESYFELADSEWYKQRLRRVLVLVLFAFAVLVVRVFYLQIIEGRELRRLSKNNCIRLQRIEANRGLIFDRNGKLMVDNRPSFNLSIIPKDAAPVTETIRKLAHYSGIPQEELDTKITADKRLSSYKLISLKKDIGYDMLASVEAHKFDLPGIVVNVKPRRQYIVPGSASHLLGYLGEITAHDLEKNLCPGCRGGDLIGKFGVEKTYDAFLRGTPGGQQVEVDANGRMVRLLRLVEALPGLNIRLTIDQELQQKAEALLSSKAGAIVAMEPSTGKILCMASSPLFDQNAFVSGLTQKDWHALVSDPLRPLENKAIQAEYPPASTYKIITALAGLEEGVINRSTTFFCPGYYRFGDRVFRCWKKGGHGHMNVIDALEQSCDVFFYQVGQKLGVDRLARYAKASGLGTPTGISLDHEGKGLVPTASWKKERTGISWQGGETLSIAIGQGYNLATPIQMLVLTAAVANGGKLVKPLILDTLSDAQGTIIHREVVSPMGRLPVRTESLRLVREGLRRVVQGRKGTARGIKLKTIQIAGKTGTAQVVGRKTSDAKKSAEVENRYKAHAWFVAYAPFDDPKIAVVVIVEHGEHGSSAAAPLAKAVIETYLPASLHE